MKKLAQGVLLLAIASISSGCTKYASLNMVGGNAYLIGDDNCERYKQSGEQTVQCFNGKGAFTGSRNAMNQQEVQVYYMERQLAAQRSAQLSADLANMNSNFNANMSSIKYPTYTPPSITPITPPGGNRVSCISAGIYTSCR